MRRVSAASAELLPAPAPPMRPIEIGVSAARCSASSASRASVGESASCAPTRSAAKTLAMRAPAPGCGSRDAGGGAAAVGFGNSAKDGGMRRSVVSVSLTLYSLARRPPVPDAPNLALWQCPPTRRVAGQRKPDNLPAWQNALPTRAMPDLLLELFS